MKLKIMVWNNKKLCFDTKHEQEYPDNCGIDVTCQPTSTPSARKVIVCIHWGLDSIFAYYSFVGVYLREHSRFTVLPPSEITEKKEGIS